jgi:hypothetical protein
MERRRGGEAERWRYGEMERRRDGETERWRDGETERERRRRCQMWVATGAPHYSPCPSINAGRMKSTGKKKDGETERWRDGETERRRGNGAVGAKCG